MKSMTVTLLTNLESGFKALDWPFRYDNVFSFFLHVYLSLISCKARFGVVIRCAFYSQSSGQGSRLAESLCCDILQDSSLSMHFFLYPGV